MKKLSLIIALVIVGIFELQAQDTVIPSLYLKAKVKENKVLLRWAVDDPTIWKLAQTTGFTLTRRTIIADGAILQNPIDINLAKGLIKPQPVEQWENRLDNDYFAIAGQSLYGENFDVLAFGNPLQSAAKKEEQTAQRMGFMLFACDMAFEVAIFCGYGFVDTDIKLNEKYAYFLELKDGVDYAKRATVFVDPQEVTPDAIIDDLTAKYEEQQVILTWNIELLKNYYTAYIIERSADEKKFTAVTDKPFVQMSDVNLKVMDNAVFIDSLPDNKSYSYRIRGIDIFGEPSSPSNVVVGKSQKTLTEAPNITTISEQKTNLKISWDFNVAENEAVEYFQVYGKEQMYGNALLLKDKIPALQREVILADIPETAMYYVVAAYGKDGSTHNSFPYMFQKIDSIPPQTPVKISAVIDSLGIVTLQWNANTEKDLAGYRVFRANRTSSDFIQVTRTHITDTFWHDTVPMNTASSVFYKLVATDLRGNTSKLSDAIEGIRPVRFPPTMPVIMDYRAKGGSVFLKWVVGSDALNGYTLIMTKENEDVWTIAQKIKNRSTKDSLDIALQKDQTRYTFAVVSESLEGLQSKMSNTISIVSDITIKAPDLFIQRDEENKQVLLRWNVKNAPAIDCFILYRNEVGQQHRTLETLSGTEFQYIDKLIQQDKIYEYRIRMVCNGKDSQLSRSVQ